MGVLEGYNSIAGKREAVSMPINQIAESYPIPCLLGALGQHLELTCVHPHSLKQTQPELRVK